MSTFYHSEKRNIFLSTLALLSFVGYAFLEARYTLAEWIPGDGAAMIQTFIVILIVGGWVWALLAATGDGRLGPIALIVFCAIAALIAIYDSQFLFTTELPWSQRIFIVLMFILSVVAIVSQVLHLRNSVDMK